MAMTKTTEANETAVKEAFSLSQQVSLLSVLRLNFINIYFLFVLAHSIIQLLAKPDELLLSSTPLKNRVSELTKRLFTELQQNEILSASVPNKKPRRHNSPFGLTPLHLHQLHPDQIWEQIERVVGLFCPIVLAPIFDCSFTVEDRAFVLCSFTRRNQH